MRSPLRLLPRSLYELLGRPRIGRSKHDQGIQSTTTSRWSLLPRPARKRGTMLPPATGSLTPGRRPLHRGPLGRIPLTPTSLAATRPWRAGKVLIILPSLTRFMPSIFLKACSSCRLLADGVTRPPIILNYLSTCRMPPSTLLPYIS